MSREIKFRSWNPNKEYMLNWNQLHPTLHNIFFDSSLEWMQFTGVKDKNGKEIYEGDIVSWTRKTWVDLEDMENGYRDKTDVSIVEYSGHGFWIKDEGFGWEGEDLWSWDEIEVIGNLYENPELIKTNG